jgi:cytoskeletal protein RodZ
MKNCPICEKVLVQKKDKTLTCMYCGWKGKIQTQELNQVPSKVKIDTNPEAIAREMLQKENSQLPQWALMGAVVLTLLGFLSSQMFKDKPPTEHSSSPSSSPFLNAAPTLESPSVFVSASPVPAATLFSPSPAAVSASPSLNSDLATPKPIVTTSASASTQVAVPEVVGDEVNASPPGMPALDPAANEQSIVEPTPEPAISAIVTTPPTP